jgi:hypothetical protein
VSLVFGSWCSHCQTMCQTFYGGLILSPYLYTFISLLISSCSGILLIEWLFPLLLSYSSRLQTSHTVQKHPETDVEKNMISIVTNSNTLNNQLLSEEPKSQQEVKRIFLIQQFLHSF